MLSHELAKRLQETATFLLSRECVELDRPSLQTYTWNDKESFLKAVRAFVPGVKNINEYNVTFTPKGTMLNLSITRSLVCHKVQDVKYECEPLLSPEEDAEMDAADAKVG